MVQEGLTTNVTMFLKSIFQIVGTYVILFTYSVKITFVALGLILIMFFVMPVWARLTQFTQKQYQEVKAECSSISQETIGNCKTVKAFGGEDDAKKSFNQSSEGVFNIGVNMAKYYACMMLMFQFFFNFAFIGTAFIASKSVRDGELTTGQVASYLLYQWQIIFGLMGLNTNLQGVAKVQGAFYEIACLITEP